MLCGKVIPLHHIMALSNIEKHYNKHPEDLRLLRRHGRVEFETTLYHLRRFLKPGHVVLDIGAGTGRYTSALMAEGYRVKAVELVRRNIEVSVQVAPEHLHAVRKSHTFAPHYGIVKYREAL